MLNETPLTNVECVRIFQGIVKVGDLRRPLPKGYTVVATDIFEVPFQYHPSYNPRRPIKLAFGKLFGGVQLGIEEIGLGKSTDFEE